MRKIREMLRLKWEQGLSARMVAQSIAVSPSTVLDLLYRAEAAGLSWPLPDLDDRSLEDALYPGNKELPHRRPTPDFPRIHQELKRKGVTLQLLWQEYKQEHPDGLQYSHFCQQYRKWSETLDVVLRQSHRGGESMQVDFAGPTIPIVETATGEVREAPVFVAVLPASNYTFAMATRGQDLRSWIHAHSLALEYFGGVPERIVNDNLKAGVTRPCRYEPDLNPTYLDLATHYGTVIVPTRPGKPRDKGKVEAAVQVVERWVLAPLRNRRFFSLAELNAAIGERLELLNHKPLQKLPGSRCSLFESIDKPALRPLPAERYVFAEWRRAKVNIDYHVEVEQNYYSVPHRLVRQSVEVRLSTSTVEIVHEGKRVASHPRSWGKGRYLTQMQHRPTSHQKHLEWTPSRLVAWAGTVGPQTGQLVTRLLEAKPHPEQGYRSCLGIMRLGKRYGCPRLEAAAHRALAHGACSYQSVKSILERNLDQTQLELPVDSPPTPHHANVRGPGYYAGEGQPC